MAARQSIWGSILFKFPHWWFSRSWPSPIAPIIRKDQWAGNLSGGTPVSYNVDQVNLLDDKNQPVQDTWADGSPKVAQDANGKDLMDKDGKPVPAIKQQDRQVTADDLDKTKNTDAVVLGTLTAMDLARAIRIRSFKRTMPASSSWTRTVTPYPTRSF